MELLLPHYKDIYSSTNLLHHKSSPFPLQTTNKNSIKNNNNNHNIILTISHNNILRPIRAVPQIDTDIDTEKYTSLPLENPGGKMVVELVGAFNQLTTQIMSNNNSSFSLSTNSSNLLFKSLKLSIPILRTLPVSDDSRSPLSKALSLALILANLQMDAEVISAGILREVLEAGALSIHQVRNRIGIGTAHLLHESFRVKNMSSRMDVLDDETAAALRKYCLTYYDVRALILDLALNLEAMRHLDHLPRYQQQVMSLEVMKIHAPLAHAIGASSLSLELEDLSFRYLFPYSYLYVDTWLRSHETGSKPLIDTYADHLLQCLKSDPFLGEMVDDISVKGRYKSRYSTMKKLLKDGRRPEDVYDILGLRVVIKPILGDNVYEIGNKACYRAREVIQSLWKEIPKRSKDYIAQPKENGYKSLHMAVDVSDNGKKRPLMEIQIRTEEMDVTAGDGMASHSLYKGGLTDPEEIEVNELGSLCFRINPDAIQLDVYLRQKDYQQTSTFKLINHIQSGF